MLDLLLKDITDPYIRENFSRLLQFVQKSTILQGEFEFFDLDISKAETNFAFPHGMNFIPRDVLVLSAVGDQRFYFRYQEFDRTSLHVTTSGPVRIRFLAGAYKAPGYDKPASNYPFVAP